MRQRLPERTGPGGSVPKSIGPTQEAHEYAYRMVYPDSMLGEVQTWRCGSSSACIWWRWGNNLWDVGGTEEVDCASQLGRKRFHYEDCKTGMLKPRLASWVGYREAGEVVNLMCTGDSGMVPSNYSPVLTTGSTFITSRPTALSKVIIFVSYSSIIYLGSILKLLKTQQGNRSI